MQQKLLVCQADFAPFLSDQNCVSKRNNIFIVSTAELPKEIDNSAATVRRKLGTLLLSFFSCQPAG